jgi:hypothetical protein
MSQERVKMFNTKIVGIAYGKYMLLQKPSTYFGGFAKIAYQLNHGYKIGVYLVHLSVHFVIIVLRMIDMFYLIVIAVCKLDKLLGWRILLWTGCSVTRKLGT